MATKNKQKLDANFLKARYKTLTKKNKKTSTKETNDSGRPVSANSSNSNSVNSVTPTTSTSTEDQHSPHKKVIHNTPLPQKKKKAKVSREKKREMYRQKGVFVVTEQDDLDKTVFERVKHRRPARADLKKYKLKWKKQEPESSHDESEKKSQQASKKVHKADNTKDSSTTEKKKKSVKKSERSDRSTDEKSGESDREEGHDESLSEKNTKRATGQTDSDHEVIVKSAKDAKEEVVKKTHSPNSPGSPGSAKNSEYAAQAMQGKEQKLTTGKDPAGPEGFGQDAASEEHDVLDVDKTMLEGFEEGSSPTVPPSNQTSDRPPSDTVKVSAESEEVTRAKRKEAARQLLEIAREKNAIEECLTKEENEMLAKFFTGQLQYSDSIIVTIDKLMGKVLEWFQKKDIELSDAIKKAIEKRDKVRQYMVEEFLQSDKYMPESWRKRYEQMKADYAKETSRVNVWKVLTSYPTQLTFGDKVDERSGLPVIVNHRHWILGCLIGPRDSKTFEEYEQHERAKQTFFKPIFEQEPKK